MVPNLNDKRGIRTGFSVPILGSKSQELNSEATKAYSSAGYDVREALYFGKRQKIHARSGKDDHAQHSGDRHNAEYARHGDQPK